MIAITMLGFEPFFNRMQVRRLFLRSKSSGSDTSDKDTGG